MIYIKTQTPKGETNIELTENTKFYTKCAECGKEAEATEEIINDFCGFLFEASRLYCEDCCHNNSTAVKK